MQLIYKVMQHKCGEGHESAIRAGLPRWEYQNPWGQSSRHRRLERPNADPERLFDFQTEDGFAV